MSTLFRTWSTFLNQAPASNATLQAQASSILRARKDNYKNAGWSVAGSSDASTAGMDGTDRWTADNKLVWAAGGVAHSWIVLKSPTNNPSTGRNIYKLLACSTGASNQNSLNETHSSAAFTGSLTTTDPTTTAGAFRSYLTQAQFLRSPVVPSHYHALYNTVGDAMFFTSPDGIGYCPYASGYLTPANGEAVLNFPCMAYTTYIDSGVGGFSIQQMSTAGQVSLWMQDGSISSGGGIVDYQFPGTGQLYFAQVNGTQGAIGSPGTWVMLPVGVCMLGTPSGGSATGGFVGSLVDISYAPRGTNTPQTTEEPASPAPSTTAKFGDLMVPNGNVTPVF